MNWYKWAMLKRFFPKQPDFFKQLSNMAHLATKAAQQLNRLAEDQPQIEPVAKAIADFEHEADAAFRDSLKLLTDTFITPIEREHLHCLFLATDDVVDNIHAVAQCVQTYRINSFRPGTKELFALTLDACQNLQELVKRIDEIKAPAELHRVSRELNRTGGKVEALARQTLAELYEAEISTADLMKERDIVLLIQKVTDAAERVTTIMEEIMLDNS